MCQKVISIYLSKSKKDDLPWTSLKYLIGEIIYGGKSLDNYDRRILLTYVEEYFGDFIHSTYQPFSFDNCRDGTKPSEYIEMENKLLGSDMHLNNLRGEVILLM